jgi:hypothetical protein
VGPSSVAPARAPIDRLAGETSGHGRFGESGDSADIGEVCEDSAFAHLSIRVLAGCAVQLMSARSPTAALPHAADSDQREPQDEHRRLTLPQGEG